MEVKVKLVCEGCERRVRRAPEGMNGVEQVDIEPRARKVTVIGYVDPSKVVSCITHRTGKKVELWPYVPYDVVEHPYAQGVYDNKVPPCYVRHTHDPHMNHLAHVTWMEVRYTTAFSDENTGACAIM